MSGAGTIIIDSIAIAGSDPNVADNIHPVRKARLLAILSKAHGDWTKEDTHFVIRCLAEAFETLED